MHQKLLETILTLKSLSKAKICAEHCWEKFPMQLKSRARIIVVNFQREKTADEFVCEKANNYSAEACEIF